MVPDPNPARQEPIQGNARGWWRDSAGVPGPDQVRPDYTMAPDASTSGYFNCPQNFPASSTQLHGQNDAGAPRVPFAPCPMCAGSKWRYH